MMCVSQGRIERKRASACPFSCLILGELLKYPPEIAERQRITGRIPGGLLQMAACSGQVA